MIRTYRKKPVVIEAVQLTNLNIKDAYAFIYGYMPNTESYISSEKWLDYENIVMMNGLDINTLEGTMKASIGDYIIKGIQGEFYPCKPDIFKATYEEVG